MGCGWPPKTHHSLTCVSKPHFVAVGRSNPLSGGSGFQVGSHSTSRRYLRYHWAKTHHFLAKTQFMHENVPFTHKLWPTPLPTNTVTPNRLYTSLPASMYIYAHCLFRLLFLFIISTAYHLLSGYRAARLLLNWLIEKNFADAEIPPPWDVDVADLLEIIIIIINSQNAQLTD